MEAVAKVRGALAKGGEIDYQKTAGILLENFRNAKIARISLESPADFI